MCDLVNFFIFFGEISLAKSHSDIQPIVGRLTFHSLAMIVAGAAALFAGLAAIILILRHATHFSNPPEQKQYVNPILR